MMVTVMTLTVAVRVVAEINRAARCFVPHAAARVTSLGFGGSRHDAGQVASITSQYCTPIPSC